MSIEDPDADRFEQLRSVTPEDDEDEGLASGEMPLDADPLDVADQHRAVYLDEDLDG